MQLTTGCSIGDNIASEQPVQVVLGVVLALVLVLVLASCHQNMTTTAEAAAAVLVPYWFLVLASTRTSTGTGTVVVLASGGWRHCRCSSFSGARQYYVPVVWSFRNGWNWN
jgi:hypothetical protein